MKKLIRITILVLILSQAGRAQSDHLQIENIDAICKDTRNNLPSYKKAEMYKDPTGGRYAYLKDKTLKMVRAESSDGVVDKKVEWYFLNDQIIFCEQTWTQTVSKKLVNNEKLYVNKGHLVIWLRTDGRPVSPSTGEFMETDNGLISYGKKLVEEAAALK